MPIVPVRNIGSGGIAPDRLQQDLQPNELSDCLNIMMHDGYIEPHHWPRLTIDVDTHETIKLIVGFDQPGFDRYVFVSTDKFYVVNAVDGAIPDQVGNAAYAGDWHSATFDEFVIFNNGLEPPYAKDMTTNADFGALTDWPAEINSAQVITAHKGMLIIANLSTTSGSSPYEVRWSNISYSGLPNWNNGVTDAGGSNMLDATDGPIRAIVPLGEALMVYQQKAVTAMTLVGGNAVWSFRRLFREGALGVDAVCQFEGMHFVVSESLIYAHNGQSVTRIADGKVDDTFFRSATLEAGVKVTANYRTHEITLLYQGTDSQGFDRAYVFNWEHGGWSRITLPPNTQSLAYLKLPKAVGSTWADMARPWFNEHGSWTQYNTKFEEREMMAAIGGSIYSWQSPIPEPNKDRGYLARYNLDFDEIMGSEQPMKHLSAIYPVIAIANDEGLSADDPNKDWSYMLMRIAVSNDGRNYRYLPDLQPFAIGRDIKIDCRATFRYLNYEIRFSNGADFKLSGLDFDLKPAGLR